MPEPAPSLGSLIQESAERLRQAGIAEPRRQTLWIWSDLSGGGLDGTLLEPHRSLEPERAAQLRRAVQRRASGEPLAHITGCAGFRHLTLRSDRRALIPRPETEGLVELLLQRVRTGVVADVGTGSGCIALSLAAEAGFHQVLGIDCSAQALALARLNSRLLDEPGVVQLLRADLGSALAPGSLDALISNPPYLTLAEYDALDRSVREWEPPLALKAGADGLETIARLLDEGRMPLRPGGWLALEVDCSRAADAAGLAGRYGWDDISLHLDLFGRERYLLARRSETR